MTDMVRVDRSLTASAVSKSASGKRPRRLHVERDARSALPGQCAVRGGGSAPDVSPHGLEKHGGRSCNLECDLHRKVAQRGDNAAHARTATPAR